jgi:hypothetical protein
LPDGPSAVISRRGNSHGIRLADKIDLVRDRDLQEYIIGNWSSDLKRLAMHELPEKYEIAAKACKRISRIKDPVVRARLSGRLLLSIQMNVPPSRLHQIEHESVELTKPRKRFAHVDCRSSWI